jgi:hypothetical protein
MKRSNLTGLFLILCATLAGAADFGLILNERFEAKDNEETVSTWTQSAVPWLSFTPNERVSFYLSLDLSLEYSDLDNDSDDWRPLFQVNRFQALWKPQPDLFVEAGRVPFEDPLAVIATGLFDGFKVSLSRGQNTLNASALYSGLQHKERAKIVMTVGDLEDYADEDQYFASQRFLFSAFWQRRRLLDANNTLDLGGLVQADMRGDDEEKLHSQYLLGKFSFPLFSTLSLTAGGIFGIKEQDSGSAVSLAGDFSAAFPVPGSLTDRLAASWYISSGSSGRELRPFFPVTAISAGEVYTPSLSGLSIVKLVYQVKPADTLYLNGAFRYFWRTTRDIIPGIAGINDSDKDNLGAELYASGVWTPLSDLSLTMGGGWFFPDGPVKDEDIPLMWKFTIGFSLSL